jgi:CAP-Gly domain-containing linker protein 1
MSTKPRHSGIPTPGKAGNFSTPSRSRASSNAGQHVVPTLDVDFVSRAFADAIKSNDPAQHRPSRASEVSIGSLSPQSASHSGRRSVTGRPSSAASSSSTGGSFPRTTSQRPKTPTTVRPPSRHSDISGRAPSRNGRAFDIGDNVRIESLGFEGTLKFLGEIDGKAGIWAGVQLSGGFAGKGKNDGTVNG